MNKKYYGIILVIMFNILSGVHAVYLSGLLKNVDTFSVIFICFSFVCLLFCLIDFFKKTNITYNSQSYFYIFLINLFTLGNWLTFFIALKYIEPAISSALANSISPIITLIFVSVFYTKVMPKIIQIIISLGIFISMIFMVIMTLSGNTAIDPENYSLLILGVISSIGCGASMAFTTITSKKLYFLGFNAIKIMKFRFFLLIIISAILAGKSNILYVLDNYIFVLIFISIIGNVIPLFLLQLSIEKLEPIVVSMLLVLAPVFYLIIQLFSEKIPFSLSSLVTISISVTFVLIGTWLNLKKGS